MMLNKQIIVGMLRKFRLVAAAEMLRSGWYWIRTYTNRLKYKMRHPEVILPPWAIAYDAYASFDPDRYMKTGMLHARRISSYITKYAQRENRVICDWGCGPMRILRFVPELMGGSNRYLGLDYNKSSIDWAKQNFASIEFRENMLSPPLPLKDAEVDVIYCVSVFTHLSEVLFNQYVKDIYRALKPGGILIATLHGDQCSFGLLPNEKERYASGGYVERGGVKEGKRAFVAYHPSGYVRNAFAGFEFLEHSTYNEVPFFLQDWWVFRKPIG